MILGLIWRLLEKTRWGKVVLGLVFLAVSILLILGTFRDTLGDFNLWWEKALMFGAGVAMAWYGIVYLRGKDAMAPPGPWIQPMDTWKVLVTGLVEKARQNPGQWFSERSSQVRYLNGEYETRGYHRSQRTWGAAESAIRHLVECIIEEAVDTDQKDQS